MNREDAYYEPEDDTDGEEIAERVDYKLKNENYPYTANNLRSALFDDGLEKHMETIATLLKDGDTAAAGVVLSSAIYTYWEECSTREVIDNL